MSMTEKDWFVKKYDHIVSQSGVDPIPYKEIEYELATQYVIATQLGEVEYNIPTKFTRGCELADIYIKPTRDDRSHKLKEILRWIMGPGRPEDVSFASMVDKAYKLGTGSDKLLRYWTLKDLNRAARIRRKQALDSLSAANDLRKAADKVADLMRQRNVNYIGGLE